VFSTFINIYKIYISIHTHEHTHILMHAHTHIFFVQTGIAIFMGLKVQA